MDTHGFFFIPPIETNYIASQFKEIYLDKIYEDYVKPGMTILDIGANIGTTTYYFSQVIKAKHVYSVEPAKEHFDILNKMLEFNKIDNVTTIQKALYIKETQKKLVHMANKTSHTLFLTMEPYKTGEEMVETITIQGLLDKYEIKEVDFLKLDVEGSEVEICSNTAFKNVANRIRSMVVERHKWNGRNENQLVDALKSVGFEVKQLEANADLLAATR